MTKPQSPHNVEAEQALLGALILDPDTLIRVTSLVRPADFYIERHSCIYQAFLDLHQAHIPIDSVTLCDRLQTAGRFDEIGGLAYLLKLIRRTPSCAHAEYYARIVRKHARLRQVITVAGKLARLAYMVGDRDWILAQVEAALLDLLQKLKD